MKNLEIEYEEIPVQIEFLDGAAIINGLVVRNADAVELLRNMEAGEVGHLVNSLLITVAKVSSGTATAEVVMKEFREQVQVKTREEFEGFRKEIMAAIREMVGEGLKEFKESGEELSEKIDKNSEELKEALEKKVTEKLQAKLDEILLKFAGEEKAMEVKERTTIKGFDFEAAVYEECRRILERTEEVAGFVAHKPGVLKRKTGDIVVDHSLHKAGLRPRTVIECKDKDLSGSNADEILAEIEEAIANREADACLYLFKSEEQMPESFRPIKIGTDYVVASCEIDIGLLVRIAKLVGGIECRVKVDGSRADVEAAKGELKNILTFLEEVYEIQRLSQLASQHSLKVSEKAGGLKVKIESSVNKALESLTEED